MQLMNGSLSADYKVKGGKLLRVRLHVSEAVCITALSITGDFFMHPEEALETLEQALLGAPLTPEGLRPRIEAFFAGDVQVVGADVDDFVQLLLATKS
ncbi:MAG: hypothetical protein JW892_03310 [Anaerolineae bacterium]|nr:hypothetical protein [Anaerolineae bacterium]